MTDSGLPIAPTACLMASSAATSVTTRAGPSGYDMEADNRQCIHKARLKTSERDAQQHAIFRGMSTCFHTYASVDLPVYSETQHAVKLALSQMDCHLSDTDVSRLLRGEMSSRDAVTNPNSGSCTMLEATKTADFASVVETCTRTAAFVLKFMGPIPYEHFCRLNLDLIGALQPTTPGYPEREISWKGAIDIINAVFFRVAHDPLLKSCTTEERWRIVCSNARTMKEWSAAVTTQARANVRALIVATTAKTPNSDAPPPGGGRGGATKRARLAVAGAATPGVDVAASTTPVPGIPTTAPRCKQQDTPDGCKFGLGCKFTHDQDKPKKARTAARPARTAAANAAATAATARAATPPAATPP